MTGTLDQIPTLDTNKKQPYGEFFVFDNAVATPIYTVNVAHSVNELSEGHTGGLELVEGKTGVTSAYADYGGTVAGTVKATDVAHGLTTGDIITIEDGANYKGVHQITRIDNDEFYFTATWVVNDGITNWQMADYIKVSRDGVIMITSSFSVTPESANDVFIFQNYINAVANAHAKSEVKLQSATTIQVVALTSFDPVLKDDRIWFTVTNTTGAGNITIKHANFSVLELI